MQCPTVIVSLFSVLEGTESQLMNRGPPNITIIERSENTTVNQGPTQLFSASEPNDTNNPVAILNGTLCNQFTMVMVLKYISLLSLMRNILMHLLK